jgi:hypothetical protein
MGVYCDGMVWMAEKEGTNANANANANLATDAAAAKKESWWSSDPTKNLPRDSPWRDKETRQRN